ncbi:hypothetical protein [Streptomyces xanthochromogenes]|uniref:hypothetical protein n=1 Tax=Streptomyces xanthochromogenes TaxID=67384 RepID=UPI002F411A55
MPATHPGVLTDEQHELVQANTARTEAVDTLTALKQKILDHGPDSVTAQELADAAARVEHAGLAAQHAAVAAESARQADRRKRLDSLKSHILHEAGNAAEALDAMARLEDAAAKLIATCGGRQQNIARWIGAMRLEGVPEGEEDAGLTWRQAGMGHSDSVTVDGRTIGQVNAGIIIGAALDRAARRTGYGVMHLQPSVLVDVDRRAVDQPEAWLRARY